MHYYSGQIFDEFRSVRDAEMFAVSVENNKDFDYNRMCCSILSSSVYPGMFMVCIQSRFTTIEERERLLSV